MGIKFFGQYLLEKGAISKEQLLTAVDMQSNVNVPLGTIALDKGFLTPAQVKKINTEQQRTDKKFGEIALDIKLLTQEQLNEILDTQKNRRLYLGEALVQKGFLTPEKLQKQLDAYKKEQEKDEKELVEIFKHIPEPKIVSAFVDLTIKMFLRVAGKQIVKAKSCTTNIKDIKLYDWTISQHAENDVKLNYLLNLPENLLLKIISSMLNKKIESLTEDTLDVAKEFVNITCGNAASKLSTNGLKIKLKPPITHNNKTAKYKIDSKKQYIVVSLLTSDSVPFEIVIEK